MYWSEGLVHPLVPYTRKMRRLSVPNWQPVMVEKTRLAGVRLFGKLYRDTNQHCLVLDLLHEPPEWNILEVLLLWFPHLDFLLPAIVLPDDDATNTVLETQVNNKLRRMMEVVFDLEVSFPARSLVGTLVVQPIDTFEDTTVDQYGLCQLTGSYRSQVVYANVNTRNLVLADLLFLAFLLILYIHHEPESLGRQNDLLVVSGTLDAEAVVGRCNGCGLLVLLTLPSLDGFVIENYLSQFVLVVRRFRHLQELAWVFLPCVEGFLEVRPIGQALADGLLRCLRVMQIAEAFHVLDSGNEHVDVWQHRVTKPRFSHKEVALVVKFLAECAESDDFRRSSYLVSFDQ